MYDDLQTTNHYDLSSSMPRLVQRQDPTCRFDDADLECFDRDTSNTSKPVDTSKMMHSPLSIDSKIFVLRRSARCESESGNLTNRLDLAHPHFDARLTLK